MKLYLFIAGMLLGQIGYCCSCYPFEKKMDDSQIERYDLIFKGEVQKVYGKGHEIAILFKVETYYKGEQIVDTVEIISPAESSACGIYPHAGEQWLIFAYSSDKTFHTNRCARTMNMSGDINDYDKERLNSQLAFLENKRKAKTQK